MALTESSLHVQLTAKLDGLPQFLKRSACRKVGYITAWSEVTLPRKFDDVILHEAADTSNFLPSEPLTYARATAADVPT